MQETRRNKIITMNSVAKQVLAVKRIFPWHIRSQCGFAVANQIKESTIPGGGTARFALQPIKAGEIYYSSELLPVKKFLELCPEKKTIPTDVVNMLKFDDASDLDRIFEHFGFDGEVKEESSSSSSSSSPSEEFTGVAREAETMEKMSWFVGSTMPHPKDPSSSNGAVASENSEDIHTIMSTHSAHINHSAEHVNSVACAHGENRFVFRATRDIDTGDEFFLDYDQFIIPTDIKEWFNNRNLDDVKTMMDQFEDDSSQQAY